MKIKTIVASSMCAIAAVLAMPAMAEDTNNTWTQTETQSDTWNDNNNNSVSTGVGNAGSHGIGSGTSDSISTSVAEATSNGVTDNSVDNSTNSGSQISVVADQELSAASTHNQLDITATEPGAAAQLTTGSNSLDGAAFSNYAGVLNNAWNTAPQSNAQATSNLAINGSMGGGGGGG